MIEILIIRQDDGKVLGFDVEGHAGQENENGYDLVCCAVSILVHSVDIALEKHLKCKLLEEECDGKASIALLNQSPNSLTEAVFSVAILGFEEIEKKYPKCVKVINKRGES